MDNKFIAIGIDLGTTNSCAAFINASGSVEIIPNSEGFRTTPSVFSIDENVVVSERNFTRLNKWLRDNGFIVEEIPYAEIAKQEGLLRCSTLPLIRD